ncbi:MAG: aspartyl protease family protein [Gammaproteobacteria bacterium]|nr:aspartyl protease family protein [Gammaproteobacteria bacterium]
MSRVICRCKAFVTGLACLQFSLLFAVQPAHAGASEWIDIQVVDGLMYMDSEIAGITGSSFIDTGAQVNAINGRFLQSEGLSFKKGRSVTMRGAFSESRRNTYREIPVTILGTQINFQRLVELDLGSPETQLILGAGFLELYIFQFDYPNSRMRLITRDSVDLRAISNVETKKNPEGGSPLVRVSLDEKTDAWLMMDTGMTGGIVIDRDLAGRLDWIDTYATVTKPVTGAISSGKMEEFRAPSLQFGEFKIESPLVWIPTKGESMKYFETNTPLGSRIASRGTSKGILGYDVLQHFVVTIDYKSGHTHFYPGEKFPKEPETEK